MMRLFRQYLQDIADHFFFMFVEPAHPADESDLEVRA